MEHEQEIDIEKDKQKIKEEEQEIISSDKDEILSLIKDNLYNEKYPNVYYDYDNQSYKFYLRYYEKIKRYIIFTNNIEIEIVKSDKKKDSIETSIRTNLELVN